MIWTGEDKQNKQQLSLAIHQTRFNCFSVFTRLTKVQLQRKDKKNLLRVFSVRIDHEKHKFLFA